MNSLYRFIAAILLIVGFYAFGEEVTSSDAITVPPATQPENVIPDQSEDVIEPKVIGARASADEGVVLNFKDVPVCDVLDYLSEKAGFVVVSDVILTNRITLVSKKPLNNEELVSLMNTVLVDLNYAAVRVGRMLKVVDISKAKHTSIPVSSGNNPDLLPDTEEVITHIIPIRYADAVKLKADISSLLSDYADFSSNEASNSLIITDTAANIKRIIKVVKSVDTQMASIASVRVFHLVYADADNTADLINEVFDQSSSSNDNNSRSNNPFDRMRERMMGGGSNNSSSSSAGVISQNIKIIAASDDDTNTVVVSGPSDTLDIVAQVVKELDTNPEEERQIFVYKLENADSANIMEILNNLFDEINSSSSSNNTTQRRGNQQQQSSSSSSDDISDDVYIEADEDTNSLLVMTSPKNYEKITPIIDELDMPIPQVLIKVLIAEITTYDNLDLGSEFSVLNLDSDGDQRLFATEFLPTDLGDGGSIKILKGDLDFTLNALSEKGKMNVLSRPYILTSNNQTATINVGQEVPFITDTNITDSGATINTVSYEDIGIILEVTPVINRNGLVTMEVAPEVSTITAETVKISDDVDATVFAKRSTNSKVSVQDGQTIVIGGLMQDDDTTVVKKVPLLGDIPLLGELFTSREIQKQKTELLIFLTPYVADRTERLLDITQHEKSMSDTVNDIDNNPQFRKQLDNMESQVPDSTEEK